MLGLAATHSCKRPVQTGQAASQPDYLFSLQRAQSSRVPDALTLRLGVLNPVCGMGVSHFSSVSISFDAAYDILKKV